MLWTFSFWFMDTVDVRVSDVIKCRHTEMQYVQYNDERIRPHQCYGFFDPRIILNSHHVRVFSTRGFERSEVDNYTSLAPIDFERLPPRSPLSFGRSLLLMEGKKNTTPTSTLLFLCFTFLYNFFYYQLRKNAVTGKRSKDAVWENCLYPLFLKREIFNIR